MNNPLKVALAQISPVWLNKNKTIAKVVEYIEQAGKQQCDIVIFGEAFIPGYPFWVELTDGARFNSPVQKELYAFYMSQAIADADEDLADICAACKQYNIACVVGTIEKAIDRGSHSLYCTLMYINNDGIIQPSHRKLMPTYEERLYWAQGDGYGLRVHGLKDFTIGALNCWENWMPLARTALYAMGEDLHIAIWPGSIRNTEDITRFIAKESRSYVISVSSVLHSSDISAAIPHQQLILQNTAPGFLANGGSCIAAPNGEWLVAPVTEKEILIVAELNHDEVKKERHNFDVAGHYSRPDVLQMLVNRSRQTILNISNEMDDSAA